MKLIITNDDGIGEPGIDALAAIGRQFGQAVVVAPMSPQSGIGHRVSTHVPLAVKQLAANQYAVDGTPADCVRLALKVFVRDADWVLAGINPGSNLGTDVYGSGTVAAAREAAILGKPSIAISQYISREAVIDWQQTQTAASRTIAELLPKPLDRRHYWNINLPHPLSPAKMPASVYCGLDPSPHQIDYTAQGQDYQYRSDIHSRPRLVGHDIDVCYRGEVAITLLGIS